MNNQRKIALGVAGAAILAGSTLGVVSLSHAETPTSTPSTTQQAGLGYGPRVDAPRNGSLTGTMGQMGQRAGYGAQDQAAYLAGELGVAQADVEKALIDYRTTNAPTIRGRDLDDAQLAAAHDALATSLAEQLKVDQAKVLAALDGMQDARQTERTDQIKTRLDAAVQDGTLTQADADAMLKAHAAGVMGFGNGRR